MPGGQTPEPQNGSFIPSHGAAAPTLSPLPLHDALPIWPGGQGAVPHAPENEPIQVNGAVVVGQEHVKSTRLNSSHGYKSYADVELSSTGPHSPSPHTVSAHSQAVEHAGGS